MGSGISLRPELNCDASDAIDLGQDLLRWKTLFACSGNFLDRPTVNSSGVVLQGEFVSTPSRFSMNFYGEDLGSGVTSVELMEENTEIGIPLARILRTARVAVKFRRNVGAAPGDWTLRLFQNGVEVATFAVATT